MGPGPLSPYKNPPLSTAVESRPYFVETVEVGDLFRRDESSLRGLGLLSGGRKGTSYKGKGTNREGTRGEEEGDDGGAENRRSETEEVERRHDC